MFHNSEKEKAKSSAGYQSGNQPDDAIVFSLIRRLRSFANRFSPREQSEIQEIIETDVHKLRGRLKHLRDCIAKEQAKNIENLKTGSGSDIQQTVDLVRDMQQKGEKGEAEAADWVLKTFYEESSRCSCAAHEPKLSLISQEGSFVTNTSVDTGKQRRKLDLVKLEDVANALSSDSRMSWNSRWSLSHRSSRLNGSVNKDEIVAVFSKAKSERLARWNLSPPVRSTRLHKKRAFRKQQLSLSSYLEWEAHEKRTDLTEGDPKWRLTQGPAKDNNQSKSFDSILSISSDEEKEIKTQFVKTKNVVPGDSKPDLLWLADSVHKEECIGQFELTSDSYLYNKDGSSIVYPRGEPRTILETPAILQHGLNVLNIDWEFDVVSFSQRADVENMPLVAIGNWIILKMGLNVHLDLDMNRVNNWLRCIEESYLDNPYHNHLHGADVMCNIYHWFRSKLFVQNMSPLDMFTTLMAAAAHDVGHDAVNNRYHIVTRSRLGTRFNDSSPLENYHTSLAFDLLYKPDNNWLDLLQHDVQCCFRSLMIELILATDGNQHQQHQANIIALVNCVQLPTSIDDDPIMLRAVKIWKDQLTVEPKEEEQSRVVGEPCEKLMVLKAALHIADIANPAKPNPICVYWAMKVTQEFFEQGDKERIRGLPVSPLCDRETSMIEDGQKGFIKFVVMPIFEPWAKLVPEAQIAISHLESNLAFWENRSKDEYQRKVFESVCEEMQKSKVQMKESPSFKTQEEEVVDVKLTASFDADAQLSITSIYHLSSDGKPELSVNMSNGRKMSVDSSSRSFFK